MKFKLPFRCELEGMDSFSLSFGFMLPKVQSSFDSPAGRKVQKKDDYSIVKQVTVQEWDEKLELLIKK